MDQDLVHRFEQIYNDNFKLIFRYIFKRVGNIEDTKDLVSESFLGLWKNISNIDFESNVRGLIFKVASNKLTDYLRKKYKLEVDFSSVDLETSEEFTESDMYRNTNSNHTRVYRNNLQILVEKLTSRERLLVDLKYKQNLTIPEVAMQMGLTESNVKVINNRLIKKLRTEWEKMKY